MPLTSKGQEILGAMKKQYGDKRGEEVFYASKSAGVITGIDSDDFDVKMDSACSRFDALCARVDAFVGR